MADIYLYGSEPNQPDVRLRETGAGPTQYTVNVAVTATATVAASRTATLARTHTITATPTAATSRVASLARTHSTSSTSTAAATRTASLARTYAVTTAPGAAVSTQYIPAGIQYTVNVAVEATAAVDVTTEYATGEVPPAYFGGGYPGRKQPARRERPRPTRPSARWTVKVDIEAFCVVTATTRVEYTGRRRLDDELVLVGAL